MSFPGVERLLHDWLVADLGVRVCTELPADLADVLPVVQAVRIGGPSHVDDPYYLMPTVSLDSFAATRLEATELADAVDLSLRRRLPGAYVLGASVGSVKTVTGPSYRPWDNTATLRRFGATYQLWIKTRA